MSELRSIARVTSLQRLSDLEAKQDLARAIELRREAQASAEGAWQRLENSREEFRDLMEEASFGEATTADVLLRHQHHLELLEQNYAEEAGLQTYGDKLLERTRAEVIRIEAEMDMIAQRRNLRIQREALAQEKVIQNEQDDRSATAFWLRTTMPGGTLNAVERIL